MGILRYFNAFKKCFGCILKIKTVIDYVFNMNNILTMNKTIESMFYLSILAKWIMIES